MLKNKLNVLSDVYSDSLIMTLITDTDYNILWSNDTEFTKTIKNNNIKKYIKLPKNYDNNSNIIVPASFNDKNFTLNILPIKEENTVEGYIIKFITLKEIIKHQMNKDYAEYQFEYNANIRAQVSGIISSATLLHDTLERMELYEDLKLLNQQVNYCYKILASTLNPTEISKYAFGMHNIVRINASEFINDILSIVNTLLRSVKITISYNFDDEVYIEVDPDRFIVMILNVIVNSIQYNFEEEKIINISLKQSDNHCILSFSDNGYGISSSKLSDVFDNIRKDNSDFLDISKKVGLGYNILHCFCEAFNAKMYLSSKENEGTTVSFQIPISKEDNSPLYVESKVADYLSNRFSNIYVAISQVVTINYF